MLTTSCLYHGCCPDTPGELLGLWRGVGVEHAIVFATEQRGMHTVAVLDGVHGQFGL